MHALANEENKKKERTAIQNVEVKRNVDVSGPSASTNSSLVMKKCHISKNSQLLWLW
jgi:hypothetical protein